MATRSSKGRAKPSMNVTPLVDVVLVLLIIFMVVLPNTEKGASVQLPVLEHAEADPDGPEPFMLSIREDGALYFEDRALDDQNFVQVLDNAHAGDPMRKLMLRADRRVSYGRVRGFFAMAQRIGFPGVMLRVGVSSEPESDTAPLARNGI